MFCPCAIYNKVGEFNKDWFSTSPAHANLCNLCSEDPCWCLWGKEKMFLNMCWVWGNITEQNGCPSLPSPAYLTAILWEYVEEIAFSTLVLMHCWFRNRAEMETYWVGWAQAGKGLCEGRWVDESSVVSMSCWCLLNILLQEAHVIMTFL